MKDAPQTYKDGAETPYCTVNKFLRHMIIEGYIDYDLVEDRIKSGRRITRKILYAKKEPPKTKPGGSFEDASWDWVGKDGQINRR